MPALVNSWPGSITGTSPLTIAVNVTSGANQALLIWADCVNSTDFLTTATVTVNGVNIGAVALDIGAHNARVVMWRVLAPTVGSYNVVITPTAGAYITAIAQLWSDVHQSTPWTVSDALVSGGVASPLTRSIAAAAGEVIVDYLCLRQTGATITPAATRIGAASISPAGGFSTSSSSYLAGPASAMSWTVPNTTTLGYAAVVLKPAATGGALAGSVALDAVAPGGGLADAGPTALTGGVTLDAVLPGGTLGLQPGVLTLGPVHHPLTGVRADGATLPWVSVNRLSDGQQVAILTAQTVNGSGNLVLTSGSITPGVAYAALLYDGTVVGCGVATAA